MKLDSHAQLSDRAAAERVRINMSWLLKLRRAAVLGQTLTILVANQVLGIDLPLVPLLGLVALGLIANVGLQLWFLLVSEHESDAIWLARGRSLLGSVLLFDLLLLTGLLYSTGGATNPFSVFYLVNLVLATVILSGTWLRVIYLTTVVSYIGLLVISQPLAIDGVPLLHTSARTGLASPSLADWIEGGDMTLYAKGSAVAFVTVALFTAYFVRRLNQSLGERDAELALERQRRSDNERLDSLATLAAGAAHELASPLSTIAVVARELELDLERRAQGGALAATASTAPSDDHSDAIEDARLIRDEVARCRRILDQMSLDAGAEVGEEMARVTPRELFDGALDTLKGRERVRLLQPEARAGGAASAPAKHAGFKSVGAKQTHDAATDPLERVLLVPRTALRRSLRALIKNALEASPPDAPVDVRIVASGGGVAFEVRDRGTGMDPEILGRAGDPFFTTKDPGRGMGLGLFLVRSLAERLDGNFVLDSAPDAGTTARLDLPASGVPIESRPSGKRPGSAAGGPGDRD
ncbi:ATP-binding protein [Planctomycetes bacterium Pla163]|uniref:ATP-binding protein n=1 Tax=Rohdeia mirabilis TaxID=2528008 RepID=UPI0011A47F0C